MSIARRCFLTLRLQKISFYLQETVQLQEEQINAFAHQLRAISVRVYCLLIICISALTFLKLFLHFLAYLIYFSTRVEID